MKRYLIFAAIGPFVGGLLMLFATTVASGYWSETNWTEVRKFFSTFFWTVQYSYLFGVVPALMIGAIDDILFHLPRIRPVLRMLIMGVIGFAVAGIDLRLARSGYGRAAVRALRAGRPGARDAVVVAGA